jgi:cobalt-zinc-cadmium efflux system membrane fusion protein
MATVPSTSSVPQPHPAPASNAVAPQHPGWANSIGRFLPNIIVFGLLAAFFYVGHHTGWKLPKSSELWGAAEIAADDWCDEHLVADSKCLECKADLKPKLPSFGWCQEHGVAECVLHHPELAQTKAAPQLPAYDTVAAIALRPRPTNNSVNTLHTKVVQFASHESAEKAGIEVDVVSTAPMREEIVANGEVVFDPTAVAHLSPQVAGRIWRVFKSVGDKVAAGEVLALVDAAQVGQAKAQLLQALHEVQVAEARNERLKSLGDVPAGKLRIEAAEQLHEAEIKVIAAEQGLTNLGFSLPTNLPKHDPREVADALRLLGIPADVASSLRGPSQTSNLFPLIAPFGGVIVSAEAVQGEVVDANTAAFVIADPSRMWLNLNVRQEDAAYVSQGQQVRFVMEDGRSVSEGRINWVSPTIDHKSRTLPVRVFLDNSDGRLRDNTFGVGRIVLREQAQAIVVPKEAVQSAGDVQLIFVRDKNYFADGAPKFFHVRQARVGARDDKFVELLAGALPGEVVATRGSNVLLAQLLRSNLGAGCADRAH